MRISLPAARHVILKLKTLDKFYFIITHTRTPYVVLGRKGWTKLTTLSTDVDATFLFKKA